MVVLEVNEYINDAKKKMKAIMYKMINARALKDKFLFNPEYISLIKH